MPAPFPLNGKPALVLFAHGARDARWAAPLQRLRARIAHGAPDVQVALAFLELMSPSLPELAAQLAQHGVAHVTIVPVFFGQGGHVMRDLPRLVQDLQAGYPQMRFRIADPVGEDPEVLAAMAAYGQRVATARWPDSGGKGLLVTGWRDGLRHG